MKDEIRGEKLIDYYRNTLFVVNENTLIDLKMFRHQLKVIKRYLRRFGPYIDYIDFSAFVETMGI